MEQAFQACAQIRFGVEQRFSAAVADNSRNPTSAPEYRKSMTQDGCFCYVIAVVSTSRERVRG